jgi:dsDNA-binding SOS-regulon protein
MAKTRDKLYDTADTMRPYVDRAMHDEDLRENLKEAFSAARDVYAELLGNRNLTATATRVASDKEIQESLKKAVDELREASRRIQGKEDHSARNKMLLLAGITAGILFNPMTGPQTRKWLMDKVTGESSNGGYEYTPPASSANSDTEPTAAAAAGSTSSS